MYTIKTESDTIHNPLLADENRVVDAPELAEEVNAIGQLTFTMPPNHPEYSTIRKRKTMIYAYDDDGEIFRGRVIDHIGDFYRRKKVKCESELAFLCDSVVRPFGYKGTVKGFLEKLIDNHNAQVDEERQFVLGNVTVEDPNDYIVRSNENPETTWKNINDRLIDLLGGYIVPRYEGGVRYIDYLADFTSKSTQTIKFGENMLDLEDYVDAADVVTCMIPYGCRLESSSPYYHETPPENAEYSGNRITVLNVNDNKDYIENDTGIALYGRVWGSQTWDDVTDRNILLKKATAALADSILLNTTLTIKALDLHLIDVDAEKIKSGQYLHVLSLPHDIDTWLLCSKIKRPLYTSGLGNTEITLGATRRTLTERIKG